ncbi:hypothetical protein BO94DRAFT_538547 [Aspergillus sclerotioniger CBS 115572]|uniref:Zn(2)-C6 fungal-type domain-containing protein n=1 Tax=Aspergillus sclerotioniger CBS 115572 TaxID=1450535 RepID=A0A317VTG0_9EURO|nr:hypothetical protein BO94DRAFT_538547 [Aspergillus sclerotioniger CBS 115572]PWY75220.1 hypothetical protein BO94DRAFT_538547 [Aspergillus sclerotioniger CBS 115572]
MATPRTASVSVQKSRVRGTGSLSPACDECRIRKVRCNKEYPKCSSCRASNLPCEFSNKGKRINHTKKLVNDVELLGSRLGKIEEALFRCLSVVEAANTPRYGSPTQPPSRPDSDGREDRDDSRRSSVDSDDSWSDGSADPFSQADRDSGIELSDCGSPLASLYSEAQAVGDQLMAAMGMDDDQGASSPRGREAQGSPDDSLRAHLSDACGLFQELATGPPPVSEPKYDDLPPALPPRTLLEGFVDAYFVELNPFLPIYDRQSVMDAIDQQYGGHSEAPDLAWVCSFNSILLHTLEAKSSAARPAGQMGDSTLERGLVVHLLLNARRCYNNFERLLQPRVANVQSLLSMALVALKYFSFTMFETVFAQACQLARTIGLHQIAPGIPQETERRHLFWSLFIIDKHAALVAGKPCLLPSYGCAIPLPVSRSGSLTEDQFTARISLAAILEEMYRRLHSARGARRGRDQLSRRASQVARRVEEWAVQYEHALCPSGTPEPSQVLAATELQYALYICRVLAQRRISSTDSRAKRREYARAGLRLLQELCDGDQTGGRRAGYAMFASVSLNYSLILFLEVYMQVLQDHPREEPSDVALLSSFAARADALAAQTTATSYTARVREVSALCCQIVTRLHAPPGPETKSFALGPGVFADPGHVMFDSLLDSFAGTDTALGLMQ